MFIFVGIYYNLSMCIALCVCVLPALFAYVRIAFVSILFLLLRGSVVISNALCTDALSFRKANALLAPRKITIQWWA